MCGEMRRNMKRIIAERLFVLLLLFVINGSTSNWQCEASAIMIGDSSNVSNEEININNNNNVLSLKEAEVVDNGIIPASPATTSAGEQSEDVKLKPVVDNRNGDQLNKTVHENSDQRASPCPIKVYPVEGFDEQSRSDANQENGNDRINNTSIGSNISDKSPAIPSVKEKHGTALEKISESIAGVISTITHSVTSIFSPGTTLPSFGQERIGEEVNCYRHPSLSNVTLGSGTNMSNNLPSNETMPEEADTEKHVNLDDDEKRSGEGREQEVKMSLIHPVSSNDTTNNTNGASSTTSSTMTMTTLSPEEVSSTIAPTPTLAVNQE